MSLIYIINNFFNKQIYIYIYVYIDSMFLDIVKNNSQNCFLGIKNKFKIYFD